MALNKMQYMRADKFFVQVANKPPFSKMHPKITAYFKDYLANEKVIAFNNRFVLNTHFPPYPSRAFENMAEHFNSIGKVSERKLYSVTLAVTNRCNYNCWHCYNAGRSQKDLTFSILKNVIRELQELSVVKVTLSGGEPLLRDDLEEIASLFDDRTCLALNTTGAGLTEERVRSLKKSGIFAVGVSLDSNRQNVHDRLRGKRGAFQSAIKALRLSSENALYPYIISVASHDFLQPDRFRPFIKFTVESGALEVHLLEPCATGKLAGKTELLLSQADKKLILNYQREIAQGNNLPILSSFMYLESHEAFGCGAGLTHLYIDGSGEVCPCNFVPLSFGNITREPLRKILDRMGCHFCKPRGVCVGRTLAKHIPSENLPIVPEISAEICKKHLPSRHSLPRFFKIQSETQNRVGKKELQAAYDQIHNYYGEFWLKEAGKPIKDLINKLSFTGEERIFEAGCGTGFASVLIASKLKKVENLTAVDISGGMLEKARRLARASGWDNIRFMLVDALKVLGSQNSFDIIFSSWVLGYIMLKPFFTLASQSLRSNGQLAFVVHKENSPYELLQIFGELIAQNPSVLQKQVLFDFPRDMSHVKDEIEVVGLKVEHLWEGKVIFDFRTPKEVLEHLLKSGAGTAFYNAIDPDKRKLLEKQFIKSLAKRQKSISTYKVIHDYISCIARKTV